MRQKGEMTDEKRLALLDEFLYSGKSKQRFETEKGLWNGCISKWLRTFAAEGKPVLSSQVAVRDMKKDPDKEELLQEIDRLKQELRLKSIDLKRTEMARDAYERMIVLAEERYGIPIRKNPMPSNYSPRGGGEGLQDRPPLRITWHIQMGLLQA